MNGYERVRTLTNEQLFNLVLEACPNVFGLEDSPCNGTTCEECTKQALESDYEE